MSSVDFSSSSQNIQTIEENLSPLHSNVAEVAENSYDHQHEEPPPLDHLSPQDYYKPPQTLEDKPQIYNAGYQSPPTVISQDLPVNHGFAHIYSSQGDGINTDTQSPRSIRRRSVIVSQGQDDPYEHQDVLQDETFNPETELMKDQHYLSEPELMKDQPYLPEPELMKDQHFLSEPELMKDQHYLPEPELMKDQHYLPEPELLKDQHYLQEPELMKDQHYLPETEFMKDQHYLPETEPMKDEPSIPDPMDHTDADIPERILPELDEMECSDHRPSSTHADQNQIHSVEHMNRSDLAYSTNHIQSTDQVHIDNQVHIADRISSTNQKHSAEEIHSANQMHRAAQKHRADRMLSADQMYGDQVQKFMTFREGSIKKLFTYLRKLVVPNPIYTTWKYLCRINICVIFPLNFEVFFYIDAFLVHLLL